MVLIYCRNVEMTGLTFKLALQLSVIRYVILLEYSIVPLLVIVNIECMCIRYIVL